MESNFDFEKEFLKAYPSIEKYSYRFGLSDDERKDLISETTLRILESRDKFKIKTEKYNFNLFIGWCIRIIHNTFINNYRRSIKKPTDSFDEFPSLIKSEPLGMEADENIIFDELLKDIISSEPNHINRKLIFGWASGVQYEALSEIFDLPLGTIKSRLFITRKKIKAALKKRGYNRK